VDEAKQQQTPHSPKVDPARLDTACLPALCGQQDSRPEKHRKNCHELKLGTHVQKEPRETIETGEVAVDQRVIKRCPNRGEVLNVHGEDAKDGDATENIEGDDALRQRYGSRDRGRRDGPGRSHAFGDRL
jgi:hypothetical protein